jgi:serine/threonine-protein kinase
VPASLLVQSARRLRVVALLYALVFGLSNPLPALLFSDERALFLASPRRWAPAAASIAMALVVALLTRHALLSQRHVVTLGLVFEVVGSFGIATAQYLDPSRYVTSAPWSGLSWVAVWMLSVTVILPSPPRHALAAALASATAVPLVTAYAVAGASAPVLSSPRFFLLVVLPYLLVVLIAYVGARLVYHLGTELQRALDVGAYRLIEPLGMGGMGEVWRAQHRLLARPAAVKVIRPAVLGGSSPERWATLHVRFEREARATSRLRSPHTIDLYDFGVAEDGAFYYVMELLEGFDLATLVERFGPVPPARAAHLLAQVCHSLAEAHAEGLVHRDIKPANVVVCRYGRDVDFVKVLDFGLVTSTREAADGHTAASALAAAGGTPAFMAPEQALAADVVDGRADIYSVGCLGYWLVTGQVVFAAPTPLATIVAHTQEAPAPPSRRTELMVPEGFDRLILACLAKHPDDRPRDAEALAAGFLSLPLRNDWPVSAARQWWDLHAPPRA